MEQKEITKPTICLVNSLTAEEFKEDMQNIRDIIVVLLLNAKSDFSIDANMIGRCYDFLDEIDTLDIVDDWSKDTSSGKREKYTIQINSYE